MLSIVSASTVERDPRSHQLGNAPSRESPRALCVQLSDCGEDVARASNVVDVHADVLVRALGRRMFRPLTHVASSRGSDDRVALCFTESCHVQTLQSGSAPWTILQFFQPLPRAVPNVVNAARPPANTPISAVLAPTTRRPGIAASNVVAIALLVTTNPRDRHFRSPAMASTGLSSPALRARCQVEPTRVADNESSREAPSTRRGSAATASINLVSIVAAWRRGRDPASARATRPSTIPSP